MKPWKWTKKIFFHLLDLTILNTFIVLASCGSKLSHQLFRQTFVRDLVQEVRRVPQLQTARTSSPIHQRTKGLDTRHSKHLPLGGKGILCHVYSTKNKNEEQNSGVHNATWGLCYPMFRGISHKTAFLRTK